MRYFKKMISSLADAGIFYAENDDWERSPSRVDLDEEDLQHIIEETRPFVIHVGDAEKFMDDYQEWIRSVPHTHLMEIAFPFPSISIEFAGDFAMTTNLKNKSLISWIVVQHKIPSNTVPNILGLVAHRGHNACSMAFNFDHFNAMGVTFYVIDQILTSKEWAKGVDTAEQVGTYRKPGNRKKRKRFVRNEVFICAPKSMKKKLGPRIDWKHPGFSHRWEVRGHWSYFWKDKENKIVDYMRFGKDQNGDYCERGRTWVKEYEKGPEDKNLIRKQRIIKTPLTQEL